MSNVKPPKTVVPRSPGTLLEKARIRAFDLKTMAEDIRSGVQDLDSQSVCAGIESRMLRAVEFLEEIEVYLRSHIPTGKLIVFPAQTPTEAKGPDKKTRAPRTTAKNKRIDKESKL